MRYALFTDKEQADAFAAVIQSFCDQHQDPSKPKIIKMAAYIDWLGKYAVAMQYEPDLTGIEVVDSVDQPMEEPPDA